MNLQANELIERFAAGERVFDDVGLSNGILTRLVLRRISLRRARLVELDLRGADLTGADLHVPIWPASTCGARTSSR